jgi:hypothetical protein
MIYAILGAGKVGRALAALLLATIMIAPAAASPASSYNDTVKTIFSRPIANVPGKSLVAVEVSYPPGGASAPHHHFGFGVRLRVRRFRSDRKPGRGSARTHLPRGRKLV